MNDQQVERLRALWKSGRDKYASFFTVLEEVRHEIGDQAFPRWCIDNLQIGISVITKTRNLLVETDAAIVKRNLAATATAEKLQAQRARMEAQRAREEAALNRERDKQQHAKKLAEAKAETQRIRAATKKPRKKRQQNPDEVGRNEHHKLMLRLSDATLTDLAKRFEKADAMCRRGDSLWIEGSMAKAEIICTARHRFPANQEFGVWCDANIRLNDDDRAGLINLGQLGNIRLREILTVTNSRSYQHIWRAHNKPPPELKVASSSA